MHRVVSPCSVNPVLGGEVGFPGGHVLAGNRITVRPKRNQKLLTAAAHEPGVCGGAECYGAGLRRSGYVGILKFAFVRNHPGVGWHHAIGIDPPVLRIAGKPPPKQGSGASGDHRRVDRIIQSPLLQRYPGTGHPGRQRYARPLSLLMMDINNFKDYNDSRGIRREINCSAIRPDHQIPPAHR